MRAYLRQLADRRRARRDRVGRRIDTPEERRLSRRYELWTDHGILRRLWTNFAEIAPGVFRSNHPHPARLEAYAARGIRAVLNLRGTGQRAPYLFEAEACAALGLQLISVDLQARKAAPPDQLLALFDAFDRIDRPFVMHCKSGADRAGLASALYLLDTGASVAEARRMLSLRYLHLRFTRTGVQDHMLDIYEDRLRRGPIGIRDWVRDEYDPDALTQSFAAKRIIPV